MRRKSDPPAEFEVGDSVLYDGNRGIVLRRIRSTRPRSDDYRVEWEDGEITIEWGSDLVHESRR